MPPALDSLMPRVSGLFAPTESRPPVETRIPASGPAASARMLSGPNGSAVGGTCSVTSCAGQQPPAGQRVGERLDGRLPGGQVEDENLL